MPNRNSATPLSREITFEIPRVLTLLFLKQIETISFLPNGLTVIFQKKGFPVQRLLHTGASDCFTSFPVPCNTSIIADFAKGRTEFFVKLMRKQCEKTEFPLFIQDSTAGSVLLLSTTAKKSAIRTKSPIKS
jgi:hypothetical protein